MAGSSAVQIGSATFVNPHTMIDIIDGLKQFMLDNKILKLGDISIRK
jgi:dihydroorotate dehydrogenase (NAD+) catalytic subunit